MRLPADQPLFDPPAARDLTTAAGHLQRARDAVLREDLPSTLSALEETAGGASAITAAQAHLVADARRQQATWQQVATALGVSRQAATERFRTRGIS